MKPSPGSYILSRNTQLTFHFSGVLKFLAYSHSRHVQPLHFQTPHGRGVCSKDSVSQTSVPEWCGSVVCQSLLAVFLILLSSMEQVWDEERNLGNGRLLASEASPCCRRRWRGRFVVSPCMAECLCYLCLFLDRVRSLVEKVYEGVTG